MTRSRRLPTARQVSGWAREIVARRLLVVAAVAGVAHVLVGTGLVPDGISEQAELWAVSAIDAVALVGAIFWARSGVTPADPQLDPTSTNGRPLVEAPPPQHERGDPSNVHPVTRADDEAHWTDPLA